MIDRVVGRDSVSMASLVDPRYEIESFRDRAIKTGIDHLTTTVVDSVDRSRPTQTCRNNSYGIARHGSFSR